MVRSLCLIATLLLATIPARLDAQGRFAPVLQVGDRVVTAYQIDQRTRFLTLLGARGDIQRTAREQLINEAIQLSAVEDAELSVPPEQVEAGMAEFAARGNLSVEQIMEILGRAGIQPETFRDFILAGVAWRELVRTQFTEDARASLPADLIRRTLAQTGTEGGTRVLVSEILLPKSDPETALASRSRAADIAGTTGEEAFAAAARRYSVAQSAGNGGELDWADLDALPPEVRAVISGLAPGQTSRPVELETAVAVFYLRDIEQVRAGTEETLLIDYALFTVDGGLAEATRVAGDVDVCEDLFGAAFGLPEDRLLRETRTPAEIPADIRTELSNLDDNETSTALTRGGNATVLMLCERKPGQENTVDLNIIGTRLLNTRLNATALHYLTELRASTIVIDLTN